MNSNKLERQKQRIKRIFLRQTTLWPSKTRSDGPRESFNLLGLIIGESRPTAEAIERLSIDNYKPHKNNAYFVDWLLE